MPRHPTPPQTDPNDWYLLHARLKDVSDPIVWRQLSVPPNITISQLHPLMIAAFGWALAHLHMWSIRPVDHITGHEPPLTSDLNPEGYSHPQMRLGRPRRDHPRPDLGPDYDPNAFCSDEDDYGLPPDETLAELDDIYDFTGGEHVLCYEYDMGDGWEHTITVEKRVKPTAVITGGKGHYVAEDSGGPYGWEDVKLAYKVQNTNRDTDDHAERREWYEKSCSNGDRRGLKGLARLKHVNIREANEAHGQMKNLRQGEEYGEYQSD